MNGRYLWNENWSFLKTAAGTIYEEAVKRKQEFVPVDIPHDWLIYDSLNLYEDSTGWYLKRFLYEETEKRAFLTFEGIYMDSTVYVNGQKAGEWKYGYSTFTLEITDYLQKGENEILVSACFLSPNSRWYSGAGIYRDVWFSVKERTYLPENPVYISTEQQGEDFFLTLQYEVEGDRQKDAEAVFFLCDEKGEETELTPVKAEGRKKKYLVREPKRWDVESPVLYTLKTQLLLEGKVIQEEREQFGFRDTKFDPERGFFLNGRHVKLNGVCEHHDLGALGAAFNRSAMKRKFRILKKMGVNAVRGTHNMMAPGFTELADEMGLGKTIQTIAFLLTQKEKTSLIIAPTSLIYNWNEEIEKFAPSLKVGIIHGSNKDKEEILKNIEEYNIILTTYGTVRNSFELYNNIIFENIVLDEGQNINNHKSQISNIVKIC